MARGVVTGRSADLPLRAGRSVFSEVSDITSCLLQTVNTVRLSDQSGFRTAESACRGSAPPYDFFGLLVLLVSVVRSGQ